MAKKTTKVQAYQSIALVRIALGFTFLWAFLDKLLGLGFATCRGEDGIVVSACEKAWINGGSPTLGFLKFGTKGPFTDFFQSLAGNPFIDWLFMLGLLLIGSSLILGIGIKVATFTGSILLLMMYSASMPPENNPIIDEHIIYIFSLMTICLTNDNQQFGLGKWWASQKITKDYPVLR